MNRLKYGWAICALIYSIMFFCFTNVYAADELNVYVPGTEAVDGEVHVPVVITQNPGITSVKLTISYDAEQLQLTKCENGNIFEKGQMTSSKTLEEVPYVVLFIDGLVSDHTATGALVVLTFQTTDAFSGMADVTVEIGDTVNFDLEKVGVSDSRVAATVKGTKGVNWQGTSEQENAAQTTEIETGAEAETETTQVEKNESNPINAKVTVLILMAACMAVILGIIMVGKKKEDEEKRHDSAKNGEHTAKDSAQHGEHDGARSNTKSAVRKKSGNAVKKKS